MPTGYTAGIKDGQSFEEFALTAARGMGACILQRDDPLSEPPKLQKVGEYYEKRLASSERELADLLAMTQDEREQLAAAKNRVAEESYRGRGSENKELADKYQQMRARVADWEPPTPEHVGLKEFMLEQIDQSSRFDCGEPYRAPTVTAEWLVAGARDSVVRAKQSLNEERERVKSRNEWIVRLYESLGMTPPEAA